MSSFFKHYFYTGGKDEASLIILQINLGEHDILGVEHDILEVEASIHNTSQGVLRTAPPGTNKAQNAPAGAQSGTPWNEYVNLNWLQAPLSGPPRPEIQEG